MNRKNILVSIIALGLIVVGYTLFHNSKSNSESLVTTQSPNDFINQSANELSGERGEAKKVDTTTLQPICQTLRDSRSATFKCYESYYKDLVDTKGIEAAFIDIKARDAVDGYVKSQCHPLTHSIGHAAAGHYKDILDAYSHGDSFCWSGYYHGILEEIIEQKGKENTLKELNDICSKVPGKDTYSFDYYNCVHGLGHGLMGTAGQNLFSALNMCDNLDGNWEKSSCYGGVFMENVVIENKGGTTKYLKPSDPIYPCTAVEEQYKSSCYLMQTSYMLKISNNDFSKVFPLCRQADAGYVETCFQSLGRDASGQSISNAEQTKNTCNLGANYSERSNCIIGAVKDFISFYHSDTEAKRLCSILSADLKQICTDTAVSYYKTF